MLLPSEVVPIGLRIGLNLMRDPRAVPLRPLALCRLPGLMPRPGDSRNLLGDHKLPYPFFHIFLLARTWDRACDLTAPGGGGPSSMVSSSGVFPPIYLRVYHKRLYLSRVL